MWYPGQPNGKNIEECGKYLSDSRGFADTTCTYTDCFICAWKTAPTFRDECYSLFVLKEEGIVYKRRHLRKNSKKYKFLLIASNRRLHNWFGFSEVFSDVLLISDVLITVHFF